MRYRESNHYIDWLSDCLIEAFNGNLYFYTFVFTDIITSASGRHVDMHAPHIHIYIHIDTHRHTKTHTKTRTRTHIHARAQAGTHAHTHAHTHVHSHALTLLQLTNLLWGTTCVQQAGLYRRWSKWTTHGLLSLLSTLCIIKTTKTMTFRRHVITNRSLV